MVTFTSQFGISGASKEMTCSANGGGHTLDGHRLTDVADHVADLNNVHWSLWSAYKVYREADGGKFVEAEEIRNGDHVFILMLTTDDRPEASLSSKDDDNDTDASLSSKDDDDDEKASLDDDDDEDEDEDEDEDDDDDDARAWCNAAAAVAAAG